MMALALQRQAVRPDVLRTESFAPYLRQFRTFLGNDRLSQVHVKVKERLTDGNRFRELVLRQKLPWLDAFEYHDRATLRGARPLRALDSPREVRLAAMAGLALGRVGATLSETLKESMRVRLLNLDGRA